MKITLRKASAVQAAIVEAVEKLDFTTTVELNEFQRPEQEILNASDEFIANSDRREVLLNALYDIRKRVAKANTGDSGVSDLLADIARVEKDIRFFSMVDRIPARVDGDVLRGKLGKLSEKTETRSIYGRDNDTVSTSIFGSEELEAMRHALKVSKKEKQRLQDALLEANIRHDIELSDTTAKVLTDEDLI